MSNYIARLREQVTSLEADDNASAPRVVWRSLSLQSGSEGCSFISHTA